MLIKIVFVDAEENGFTPGEQGKQTADSASDFTTSAEPVPEARDDFRCGRFDFSKLRTENGGLPSER
jgi:hypothetical protein